MEAIMTDLSTPTLRNAVLDRGFVYVGICALDAGVLTITGARCVRRWGTERGLAQLAAEGPTAKTKLEASGTVHAPQASVIHLIDCAPAGWAATLAEAA
jgi:hypothetical protein